MDSINRAAEYVHRKFSKEPWFIVAGVVNQGVDIKPAVGLQVTQDAPNPLVIDEKAPELEGHAVIIQILGGIQPVRLLPVRLTVPDSMQLTRDRLLWLVALPVFEYTFRRAILSPAHKLALFPDGVVVPIAPEEGPVVTIDFVLGNEPSVFEYAK